MDQYFYVIREERCRVVVQKPIIRHQQQVDHVKLMTRSDEFPELYHLDVPTHQRKVVVKKPIIRHQQQEDHVKLMTRPDEFPELYHLDMPTHQREDHYRPSNSNMRDYDTSYGGGGGCGRSTTKPAGQQYPAPPPHQVNVCQGPVAAQVQKRVMVPPQCQDEKVFYYPGNHPTQPPPPPRQKPASETAIDSNEAARLYGGILIKDFRF